MTRTAVRCIVSAQPTVKALRIISFNIRYMNKNNEAGEEPWSTRCPRVVAILHFLATAQRATFICLQEVLHNQLEDILAGLGPDWAHIGRGRETGPQDGEYSPVLYHKTHYSCERSAVFWLSETPTKPSKGWDAACERIVTMGQFQPVSSALACPAVVVMSTHFDHAGVKARELGAKLILRLTDDWISDANDAVSSTNGTGLPAFLAGDLNSTPDDVAYGTLTAPGAMTDVRELVPAALRSGHVHTYSTFRPSDSNQMQIDHVFVRHVSTVQHAESYSVVANVYDDGVFLSDHRPVVVDVCL